MLYTVNPANRTAPGHLDSRERWTAARVTASHLNVVLQRLRTLLDDEERETFTAAKHLCVSYQSACGVFLDGLHTATSIDELIDLNNEFYRMAVAKS